MSTSTTAQFAADSVKTLPQQAAPPPPSGMVSGPRYRVLRPHARGGLGEVFIAEDMELGRHVALKEIQARYADHADSRTRFVLEAEITGGLEHPGIVPVYGLGAHPDGRPYYAMRFIQGESLREAITRFHDADAKPHAAKRQFESLPFRQLLSRFNGVCQAVAYAHSRGVIHRDLKPSNVMLGKFGETLVVDWGLAKTVGRHEPTPDGEQTLQPRSGSDSSATEMGQALGTPAYMSPEQADGRLDRLGPPSDIYSLGATLYDLLTGRPPQTGDVVEILDRVRRGVFVPPRDICPSVPKPLEAICLKAMSLDPAGRYPTADALAADLERWLADERVSAYREPIRVRLLRRMKRHRTLVAGLAAVVITGLVSLGVLLVQSEKSRHEIKDQLARAVEARDYTRQALDDMTSEFTEGELKAQKALTPAQRQFLDRALGYYRKFANEPGDDRDGRERLANASHRLGVINFQLGHLREADEAYRQAEELFTGLAAALPERTDYRIELARVHHNRGNVLAGLVELPAAEKAFRASVAIREELLRVKPDDPDYRSQLAFTQRSLGILLRQQGKRPDAAKCFRMALDLLEKLVAQFPSVTDKPAAAVFHWEFARSRTDIGNLYFELREPEKAEVELGAAAARFEELLPHFHDEPEYRDELAVTYLNWGRVLQFLGETERAETALQAGQRLEDRLVAEYPGVPEYRRTLGQIRINLAVVKAKKMTMGRSPAKRPVDVNEAESIAASPDATGEDLYRAACGFASAAAHADATTAERHAAHAVAVLRQAFARGFRDVPRMVKAPELGPLRNRADYIQLLWDVAEGR